MMPATPFPPLKLQAALLKTSRGRVYISLFEDLPSAAVGVVYDTANDVMKLMLGDDSFIPIAQDMDLEFSETLKSQEEIALISGMSSTAERRVNLPLSLQ